MSSNKGFTITTGISSWNWSLSSSYSQRAVLLHFYEIAFNVAQHWPIAAILLITLMNNVRNQMLEWMNVWALIQRKNRESLTSVQDHHMLVWLVQVEQKAAWLLQIAPLLCSVLSQVGPAKQTKKKCKNLRYELTKRRVLHRDLNQPQSPENFSNKIRQFWIDSSF